MMWVVRFPMPPSVNNYLMPTRVKGSHTMRLVKTEIHRKFMSQCLTWRSYNYKTLAPMIDKLKRMKDETEAEGRQFALRVDAYFAFGPERIKVNDANNRLKPVLDGIVKVLEIDDRYFYSGICEKVLIGSKEFECTYLKISPMIPRTLSQIQDQILMEMKLPAT